MQILSNFQINNEANAVRNAELKANNNNNNNKVLNNAFNIKKNLQAKQEDYTNTDIRDKFNNLFIDEKNKEAECNIIKQNFTNIDKENDLVINNNHYNDCNKNIKNNFFDSQVKNANASFFNDVSSNFSCNYDGYDATKLEPLKLSEEKEKEKENNFPYQIGLQQNVEDFKKPFLSINKNSSDDLFPNKNFGFSNNPQIPAFQAGNQHKGFNNLYFIEEKKDLEAIFNEDKKQKEKDKENNNKRAFKNPERITILRPLDFNNISDSSDELSFSFEDKSNKKNQNSFAIINNNKKAINAFEKTNNNYNCNNTKNNFIHDNKNIKVFNFQNPTKIFESEKFKNEINTNNINEPVPMLKNPFINKNNHNNLNNIINKPHIEPNLSNPFELNQVIVNKENPKPIVANSSLKPFISIFDSIKKTKPNDDEITHSNYKQNSNIRERIANVSDKKAEGRNRITILNLQEKLNLISNENLTSDNDSSIKYSSMKKRKTIKRMSLDKIKFLSENISDSEEEVGKGEANIARLNKGEAEGKIIVQMQEQKENIIKSLAINNAVPQLNIYSNESKSNPLVNIQNNEITNFKYEKTNDEAIANNFKNLPEFIKNNKLLSTPIMEIENPFQSKTCKGLNVIDTQQNFILTPAKNTLNFFISNNENNNLPNHLPDSAVKMNYNFNNQVMIKNNKLISEADFQIQNNETLKNFNNETESKTQAQDQQQVKKGFERITIQAITENNIEDDSDDSISLNFLASGKKNNTLNNQFSVIPAIKSNEQVSESAKDATELKANTANNYINSNKNNPIKPFSYNNPNNIDNTNCGNEKNKIEIIKKNELKNKPKFLNKLSYPYDLFSENLSNLTKVFENNFLIKREDNLIESINKMLEWDITEEIKKPTIDFDFIIQTLRDENAVFLKHLKNKIDIKEQNFISCQNTQDSKLAYLQALKANIQKILQKTQEYYKEINCLKNKKIFFEKFQQFFKFISREFLNVKLLRLEANTLRFIFAKVINISFVFEDLTYSHFYPEALDNSFFDFKNNKFDLFDDPAFFYEKITLTEFESSKANVENSKLLIKNINFFFIENLNSMSNIPDTIIQDKQINNVFTSIVKKILSFIFSDDTDKYFPLNIDEFFQRFKNFLKISSNIVYLMKEFYYWESIFDTVGLEMDWESWHLMMNFKIKREEYDLVLTFRCNIFDAFFGYEFTDYDLSSNSMLDAELIKEKSRIDGLTQNVISFLQTKYRIYNPFFFHTLILNLRKMIIGS